MNKQSIASVLFGLCVAATQAAVINIDNAELTRLAASGVAVIDIRTEPEWKATGVIAGSELLTFVDEEGRVDSSGWLEKIKSVAKPEQPIILICRSGNRSIDAGHALEEAGFTKVHNVLHGFEGELDENHRRNSGTGWRFEGLPWEQC